STPRFTATCSRVFGRGSPSRSGSPFLFPLRWALFLFKRFELRVERDPACLLFGAHARERRLTLLENGVAVLNLLELRPDRSEHVRRGRVARFLVEVLQHLTQPWPARALEVAYLLFSLGELARNPGDPLFLDLQPGNQKLRPQARIGRSAQILAKRTHFGDNIVERRP